MSKLNKALEFIASHGKTKFSTELQEGLGSVLKTFGKDIMSAGGAGLRATAGAVVRKGLGSLVGGIQGLGGVAETGLRTAEHTLAMKGAERKYRKDLQAASADIQSGLNDKREELKTLKSMMSIEPDPEQKENIKDQIDALNMEIRALERMALSYKLRGDTGVIGGLGARGGVSMVRGLEGKS